MIIYDKLDLQIFKSKGKEEFRKAFILVILYPLLLDNGRVDK
jgi:hypothetical protein